MPFTSGGLFITFKEYSSCKYRLVSSFEVMINFIEKGESFINDFHSPEFFPRLLKNIIQTIS